MSTTAMSHLSALLTIIILLGAVRVAWAQQPLNLDFERISTEGPARPWNWTPVSQAPDAKVSLDSTVAEAGVRSLRISQPEGSASEEVHALATRLHPFAALGNDVRLSGWTKMDDGSGRAYVTVETRADSEVLVSDTIHTEPGDWAHGAAMVSVALETEMLVITANLEGAGTAWFDNFSLEIDGHRVTELPLARDVGDSEIEWLTRHAAPLRTVDPAPAGEVSEFTDLRALDSLIGNAKIVALGESIHGASEFFRLKHRALEYLVRVHGFRLFAIEDQQLGMERINEYVLGGPGSAQEAMRGMFGVWHTEEVRDLIEWMRAYNAQHPADPVEFVGFDMQNPSLPIDSLRGFARTYEPALADTLTHLLGPYREAWRESAYPQGDDSTHHRWAEGAAEALRLVEERRDGWLARAGSAADTTAIDWAVQNARVVAQAGRHLAEDQPVRDSSMAANLSWHLERRAPETRAVVWAHDFHISKGSAETARGNYFDDSMGMYLHRQYGESYRAFGLMSYDGTYTAVRSLLDGSRDLAVIEALPAPRGSFEEAFHRVATRMGSPLVLIDLRAAHGDPRGRMLLEPRPTRLVGYAAVDYGFHEIVELGHQFDGLLFVDRTSGTRPLGISPWPPESD